MEPESDLNLTPTLGLIILMGILKIELFLRTTQYLTNMIKNLFTCGLLILSLFFCNHSGAQSSPAEDGFTFVFLTDIHLKPEMRATEGFQMAIDTVNAIHPDFVLTGGDLIDDALNASHGRADSLYQLYIDMSGEFQMPVYNAMGNHEHYGYSSQPPVDPSDPDYGEGMFERRIGKRY
ncbi:MAG: metallophosphoesterase family protein, partial [Bacteroidales bacterium]